MSPFIRRLAVASTAATLFLLTACASGSASPGGAGPGLGAAWPDPPTEEVRAQGTVLDAGGEVQLCLGAVAESAPPQCSGIPVDGWSWDGVDGSETVGDVTWGSYAVTGFYDGERLKITKPPIMLALYDPIRPPDPTDGVDGTTDQAALEDVQEALPSKLGTAYLGSWPDRGYLWTQVVWDDGTLQAGADAEWGDGVVIVQSAFTPFD